MSLFILTQLLLLSNVLAKRVVAIALRAQV